MDKWKKIRVIGLIVGIFFVVSSLSLFILRASLPEVHAGGPRGRNTRSYPVVNIRPVESRYSWGGVMSFPNIQNVAVYLDSYNVSGDAEITLYKASEQNLLNYLVHDDKNNQTNTDFSTADFPVVSRLTQRVQSGYDHRVLVDLPISDEIGIWYFTVKLGSASNHGFIIKSSFGLSAVESKDSYIFWAQDFKTHQSVSDVEVTTISLLNGRQELSKGTTNAKGIRESSFSALADVALARRGNDYALLPLNLSSINTGYLNTRFDGKYAKGKYFVFTDRPIYKPGDTVYFKAIVRDTEGAGYLIPDEAIQIRMGSEEKPLFEKTYTLSDLGTADGEFTLPTDVETGYQYIVVSLPQSSTRMGYDQQYVYFQIENYRKPEYFLDITSTIKTAQVGDSIPIELKGTFFSGHPASDLDVSYTVSMSEWSDYQWNTSFEESASYYGSFYGTQLISNKIKLDQAGAYQLNIDTKEFAKKITNNKIISVDATLTDSSGNVSTRTKNFLLYSADYTAYLSEKNDYSVKVGGDAHKAYTLKPNKPDTKVQSLKANYSVERTNWEKSGTKDQYGYDSYVEKKYSIVKNVQDTIDPSEFENYVVSFPVVNAGSYHVTISFTDKSGGIYSREDWLWVYSPSYTWYGYDGESLSVKASKNTYTTDEIATVVINAPYTSGDVLVALGKRNVLTHTVLPLTEGIASYSIQATEDYLPQTVVFAYGFTGKRLLSGNTTISFDTSDKKLSVAIKPDKKTYGPGETAKLEVTTKDTNGNGVPAEVAVWAMDKALTELVDGNKQDIYNTFWTSAQEYRGYEYYSSDLWLTSASSLENINFYDDEGGMGGCFGADTEITMSDGKTKPISKVVVGDMIRTLTNAKTGAEVVARVAGVHTTDAQGYLLINGRLAITPNHILFADDRWRMAGNIQIGEFLALTGKGTEQVTSIEYVNEQIPVYNLTIDTYHTFVADGVWVHNQKGGAVRSVFKDTAYWDPRLQTNTQGTAMVSFSMPDNLTTWVLNAVAVGDGTKVGSGVKELIVTKDVIVRPITANQYRVGDTFKIEASIENYTDTKQTFNYSFTAPELTITKPEGTVTIDSNDKAKVVWDVYAKSPNKDAIFTFSAISKDPPAKSDTIQVTVPITDVYLEDDVSAFAVGNHEFTLNVPDGADMQQSNLKLSLASSISHTLPASLEYLISYPYGCTEQTTTRLFALLIAKEYPDLFEKMLKGKDTKDMIEKGIKHLISLQRFDGGWGYWTNGESEFYTSMYVSILLKRLMIAGYAVPDYAFENVNVFILNKQKSIETKEADMLALSLVYRSVVLGQSPDTSSVGLLKKQVHFLGDSAYWPGGDWRRYGSVDSSTGLALQALVIAKDTDVSLHTKAIRYLIANKKYAYWSHTFGTLQAVYGILLSQTDNTEGDTVPYSVQVGGVEVSSGTLRVPEEKVIELPLGANASARTVPVSVTYGDKIQGYSTITAHWVHTKPSIPARHNGMKVTRTYENATDKAQSIGIGDMVNVIIDVSGDRALDTSYIVVEDQLPSGMIPINTRLKNENENTTNGFQYRYGDSYEYGLSNVVIGSNGWYGSTRPKQTFTYKARVVSAGSFTAPPVRAQLMYLPEVSGHSSSDSISIQEKGSVPLPIQLKRTGVKSAAGVFDWVRNVYLWVTSPLEALFTREYINDLATLVFGAMGIGLVIQIVQNRLHKVKKHKHMQEAEIMKQAKTDESSTTSS